MVTGLFKSCTLTRCVSLPLRLTPIGLALRGLLRRPLPEGEALGNGVDGEIRLFFVDHQRRTEANGRSAGAENQQSAPEAFIEDRVAKLARNQFNANHQAEAANIDDRRLPLLHSLQFRAQVFAELCGI